MKLLHVERHPTGPRCWVLGQRVHHGTTGLALIAAGIATRKRALSVIGLALIAHDRADARRWFAREGLDRPLSTV